MAMTDEEAVAECERWLDYLRRKQERAEHLQRLSLKARRGTYKEVQEAQEELRQVDKKPVVYDAANLAIAVQHLCDRYHYWRVNG